MTRQRIRRSQLFLSLLVQPLPTFCPNHPSLSHLQSPLSSRLHPPTTHKCSRKYDTWNYIVKMNLCSDEVICINGWHKRGSNEQRRECRSASAWKYYAEMITWPLMMSVSGPCTPKKSCMSEDGWRSNVSCRRNTKMSCD